MTNECTFNFGSTETMTGHIQNIVDSPDDPEVSVLVTARNRRR